MNMFPGLVHTTHHIMGIAHARSRYHNHKEGDVEGRVINWSEVVVVLEGAVGSPPF